MSSITLPQNQHLARPPNPSRNEWTDDETNALTRMWCAGGSAREIEAEFNGKFSRNAIIGKANRLGLARVIRGPRKRKEAKPAGPAPDRRARFHPAPPPKPEQVESVNRFEEPSDGLGVAFLDLTNETCRWPKGTPGEPGFVFCGEATADLRADKPYCLFHMRKRRVS